MLTLLHFREKKTIIGLHAGSHGIGSKLLPQPTQYALSACKVIDMHAAATGSKKVQHMQGTVANRSMARKAAADQLPPSIHGTQYMAPARFSTFLMFAAFAGHAHVLPAAAAAANTGIRAAAAAVKVSTSLPCLVGRSGLTLAPVTAAVMPPLC